MPSFVEDVKNGLDRVSRTQYNSMSDMAAKIKASQPVISKLLAGKAHPRMDVIGKMLDALGAKIVFPDEIMDKRKKCVFITGTKPAKGQPVVNGDDYTALPLVDMAVAAKRGGVRPNDLTSWMLVHAKEPALNLRTNLLAMRLDDKQQEMEPTLSTGDLVVVDMGERNPATAPGGLFLVRDPDGNPLVRRVKVEERKGVTWFVLYGDRQGATPHLYSLEEYHGDVARVVVGRVVWACVDMARKL